jgi:hypothetical protein
MKAYSNQMILYTEYLHYISTKLKFGLERLCQLTELDLTGDSPNVVKFLVKAGHPVTGRNFQFMIHVTSSAIAEQESLYYGCFRFGVEHKTKMIILHVFRRTILYDCQQKHLEKVELQKMLVLYVDIILPKNHLV